MQVKLTKFALGAAREAEPLATSPSLIGTTSPSPVARSVWRMMVSPAARRFLVSAFGKQILCKPQAPHLGQIHHISSKEVGIRTDFLNISDSACSLDGKRSVSSPFPFALKGTLWQASYSWKGYNRSADIDHYSNALQLLLAALNRLIQLCLMYPDDAPVPRMNALYATMPTIEDTSG